MPWLELRIFEKFSNMDDAKMFPNFNVDFFSDFINDNDITNIGDDISDGEIISCPETIEKEQESVRAHPNVGLKH